MWLSKTDTPPAILTGCAGTSQRPGPVPNTMSEVPDARVMNVGDTALAGDDDAAAGASETVCNSIAAVATMSGTESGMIT
jgi:hypothetical protein